MFAHTHVLIVLVAVCLSSFVVAPFAFALGRWSAARNALVLAVVALALVGSVGL